jgi:hypothetical protein
MATENTIIWWLHAHRNLAQAKKIQQERRTAGANLTDRTLADVEVSAKSKEFDRANKLLSPKILEALLEEIALGETDAERSYSEECERRRREVSNSPWNRVRW